MQWKTGSPSYANGHHKLMYPSYWLAIKFVTEFNICLVAAVTFASVKVQEPIKRLLNMPNIWPQS